MSERLEQLAQMLQADGLPGVLISNRPLRDISKEVITHLQKTHTPIYVRHGQLVRIQHKEDGTPFIETLSTDAFRGILARAMNFVKITREGPRHIPPPENIVKDILSVGNWPLPPLESIVEFPVFRPDGTLITTPGYDAATRLVYAPVPSLRIPPIPEHPTDEEIVNALALLDEAIGEFPFQDGADGASYANALGLLLTPIIRQSIKGHVPLALIDATRPGTGKSLLAEIVAMIATGRKAAMIAAPYDDDEWRKRIASTLAPGATIIVIDNVKARLQSAALDLALTSSTVQERILGRSENGTYAQRATWMATGNNLQLGGDLPRRSYWIRMDAHTDKPWMRGNFKHDLETWVPAHRGELIAALLTLARAWFAAGKPSAKVPQIGSFQEWANTVGGILAHCWMYNFLSNLNELHEQADEDARQWAAFLHALHEFYGEQEFLVSTLAKDIKAGSFDDGDTTLGVAGLYNTLPDELSDTKKGDFKRKLGKALSARVGSHFDESGLHLVKSGKESRSGSIHWKVEYAGLQVSQEAIPQKEENFFENTPSSGLGGAGNADFEDVFSADMEGNKPAKPANLQEEEGDPLAPDHFYLKPEHWPYSDDEWTDEDLAAQGYRTRAELGYPLPHLLRLRGVVRVSTLLGPGMLKYLEPRSVGVVLDDTQALVYFSTPQQLALVRPLEEEKGGLS